jgi:hypothetical protein
MGRTQFSCTVMIDLQGSHPNVARDMLSQYGDHSCEIVLNSDLKKNEVLGRRRI